MNLPLDLLGWIMLVAFVAVVAGLFAWSAWRGETRTKPAAETTGDFDGFDPSAYYDHPPLQDLSFEKALSAPAVAAEQ